MEGRRIVSSKLKFVESKIRYRAAKVNGQSLITAANNHGLIIIAVENEIKAVNLDTLVQHDRANTTTCDLTQFLFTIPLTFKPSLLTVAHYGFSSILLVCGISTDGRYPVAEAIDLDSRTSIGKVDLTELAGSEIRDCAWHPNYFDSIIAICTSRGTLGVLAIDKNVKGIAMVYSNSQYGALTCCWSPKGKNLAIGLSSGRIIRLEPVVSTTRFTLKEVDKSSFDFSHEKMTHEHQIVKLIWVNKTFLLCVHAKLNNSKPDTIYSIITTRPYKPYLYWTNVVFENKVQPDYQVYLTNLSNAVVCATNASGEAAVIGVDGAQQIGSSEVNDWTSVIIDEEGARIELPLDNDNRETYPVGVALAYKSYMPDKPIIIFYTSDGVLCPYSATHTEDILKRPEPQPLQDCPISVPKTTSAPSSSIAPSVSSSTFAPSLLGASIAPSSFGAPATLSTFGAPASLSTFGAPATLSTFGAPALTSTFGSSATQSTFGSPAALSAFGAPAPTSTFGASVASGSLGAPTTASSFGASLSMSALSASIGASIPAPTNATSVPSPSVAPKAPTASLTSSLSGALVAPSMPSVSVAPSVPSVPSAPSITSVTSVPSAPSVPIAPSAPSVPVVPSANSVPVAPSAPKVSSALSIPNLLSQLSGIESIKKSSEFNEVYMSTLDDINQLRTQVNEVAEFHMLHRQALDAVKSDIDKLDMDMLEALYLIEYIKSRRKTRPPKNSVDPTTVKKVEEVKVQSRQVAEKLRDLNLHVDVTWENHLRTTNKNKAPNSLQMIYKTLAVHQKIISVLKSKAAGLDIKPPEKKKTGENSVLVQKNVLDPAKLESFRRFLASRNTVPVRHPVRLR